MENNFDNYFKEKFENRKFEMKPEYWEGAEALIEADERNGRWRKFMVLFGLALLVGVVGVFVWKNNTSTATSIVEENPNFNNENVLLENQSKDTKALQSEDLKSNQSESNSAVVENNFNDISKNNTAQPNNNTAEKDFLTKENNRISKVDDGKNVPLPDAAFSNTIPNNNSKSAEERGILNQNQNTKTLKGSNVNPTETGAQMNKSDVEPENNFVPIVINKNESSSTTKDEINPKAETKILNVLEEKEAEKPVFGKQTIAFISPLNIFLNPQFNFNKDFEIEPKCYPLLYPKKRFEFGATAGVVGYPLIENSSTEKFIGFKGGFLVEHNLKTNDLRNKWTLGVELLYHYRSGNFVATKVDSIIEYGFGRTSNIVDLTPKNLHYLEMPIYLKYHYKRMSFEGGGLVSYLLGVRGDVNQNNETTTGWVTNLGFRKIHTNAILGLQYRISDKLRFGVRANYSLNSILDKNAVLPNGDALRESGPLYLTFKVSQYFK